MFVFSIKNINSFSKISFTLIAYDKKRERRLWEIKL